MGGHTILGKQQQRRRRQRCLLSCPSNPLDSDSLLPKLQRGHHASNLGQRSLTFVVVAAVVVILFGKISF